MKSLAEEDLDLPMKEKGSLSSSSPLFGILEVVRDTTMLWKIDVRED